MSRVLRLLWPVVLIVAVAGVVLLLITGRSALEDRQRAADETWAPLVPVLDARYATLAPLPAALGQQGAADRDPTRALRRSLAAWQATRGGDDAEAQTQAANAVEGATARVRAMIGASDRLKAVAGLQTPFEAYDKAAAPPELVLKDVDAVAKYREARTEWGKRLAAFVFGYGPRDAYAPITP